MNSLIFFIVFSIIIFIYIHVIGHLKISNDLEIYEINNNINKETINSIIELKQPVIFSNSENIKNIIFEINEEIEQKKYEELELNVYNKALNKNTELMFNIAVKLFEKDDQSKYYSCDNQTICNDTSISYIIKNYETDIKPIGTTNYTYDLILGSINTTTLLKYYIDNRIFIIPITEQIEVILIPPKYIENVNIIKEYENLKFYSNEDVFNAPETVKYKMLKLILNVGDILYIPPYWMYSLKLINSNKSKILELKYSTFFSNISITPELLQHILQIQNLKLFI